MATIRGIFSASMSILNEDLSLDISSTIEHAKKVDNFGAGPAFLGSTSQAQLISIHEKKELIKGISKQKFKNGVIIGTGCNSLKDTTNIISHALEHNLNIFLIGNVAYYKNDDEGVFNFYSKIIEEVPEAKIIIYNFNKLMNYTFSAEVVKKLVKEYPENIIGMKDSSGNLWDNLKIPNFSMMVGSEAKLLKGLKFNCTGCISATTNVTHSLARKVYEDFKNNKIDKNVNDQLIKVRTAFELSGSLISAVHTLLGQKDAKYKRLLPPLSLLSRKKEQELMIKLKELDFISENIAA